MKRKHTIFFAIPFDSLTKKNYETICKKLVEHFKESSFELDTIIGNEQISPSTEYATISNFKAQNTELHEQFAGNIKKADIFVADLTNNNPNVHIELGLALALNKNILRVTGRPLKELGFDIQNLEASAYKDTDDLFTKIKKYIETFRSIKELPFSDEHNELYKKIPKTLPLPGTPEEMASRSTWTFTTNNEYSFSFRDGAIKLACQFLSCLDHPHADPWIGIYFRVAKEISFGSTLLCIKKNGSIDLITYDYAQKPKIQNISKNKSPEVNEKLELLIEIENNELEISVGSEKPIRVRTTSQAFGNVIFATYECQATFENIEMINRDSVDF